MCAGHWWGFICKWGVPACKSIFTRSVSEFFLFEQTHRETHHLCIHMMTDWILHHFATCTLSFDRRDLPGLCVPSNCTPRQRRGFEKSTIFHGLKRYMVHCLNDKVVGKPKKDPARVHPKWCLSDSLWMFRVGDADVFHSPLTGVFSWTAFNYSIRVKQLQTKHLLPSKL